jgi:hypothetical protein
VVRFERELLANDHPWLRIADPGWTDPLDPTFAAENGGRWNPPYCHPTLYFNEDIVTARINMQLWTARWPYEPEDLRPEHAPVLVTATLPRSQQVADVHTPAGVRAAGLPATYPLDADTTIIDHHRCETIGAAARAAGLRGIRCRSARAPHGAGRELAWFPATSRSRATLVSVRRFPDWYWA